MKGKAFEVNIRVQTEFEDNTQRVYEADLYLECKESSLKFEADGNESKTGSGEIVAKFSGKIALFQLESEAIQSEQGQQEAEIVKKYELIPYTSFKVKLTHKVSGLINGLLPTIGVINDYRTRLEVQDKLLSSAFFSTTYAFVQAYEQEKNLTNWKYEKYDNFVDIKGEMVKHTIETELSL